MRAGGDWSLDLCFAGLVSNMGPQNVRDIPWRVKHREWGGLATATDWGKERRTLGYTPHNAQIPELQRVEYEALIGGVKRIWLDERMESFQKYRELGLDKTPATVIVVAGHDRFWNHSPSFVRSLYGDRFEAMLLDNWYEEYEKLPFKVRRIGWSTNFDHYWTRPDVPPEKDIDISFIGYNSHPDRARYIDHIEKRWPDLKKHIVLERTPDTMGQFVSKAQYFDVIQRSKIALNLRGAADRGKTMRAYEIPYVGSFMLSQDIDDPGMAEDFRPMTHCQYFGDEDELDFEIERALTQPVSREMIAETGHMKAIGPLSVKERWGDVLRWLDE